jgi:hypothetical protein
MNPFGQHPPSILPNRILPNRVMTRLAYSPTAKHTQYLISVTQNPKP